VDFSVRHHPYRSSVADLGLRYETGFTSRLPVNGAID
jgi:hypothetical protein